MRSNLTFAAGAAVFLVALFSAGQAQAWGGKGMGGKRPMMQAFKELDLSKEQRRQIHEVVGENKDELRGQAKRFFETKQHLMEAIHSPTFDESAVRAAARAQAKEGEELAVQRAKTASRIAAILTPEQRAKFAEKRRERFSAFKEKFQERRGGAGFGAERDAE